MMMTSHFCFVHLHLLQSDSSGSGVNLWCTVDTSKYIDHSTLWYVDVFNAETLR